MSRYVSRRDFLRVGGVGFAGAAVLGTGLLGLSESSAAISDGPVPRADPGPGSMPEPGLQGQVPLEDRESGRSQQGYNANLELLGQYQGEGASWVNPSYGYAAYMATTFSGIGRKESPGVQVVDVSDPRDPRLSTTLTSPAMRSGPWESLKVNEERGLLGGVSVGPVNSGLFADFYDISEDPTKPRLLNSLDGSDLSIPANVLGHEGEWAPDGMTYYASGLLAGSITAIDTSDPSRPKILFTGSTEVPNHGFQLSEDGNRLYMASIAPAGVVILDVSDIQERKPVPMIRQVGRLFWSDGGASQHSIPITYKGKPHLVMVDEFGVGGVRFIDITDETNPRTVSKLRLEIQMPEHREERRRDTTGNGLFGYESHYATVDRKAEPTALAVGYFQSGIRVFDIRDIRAPREIAYYNPPAQTGKNAELAGSEHANGVLTSQSPPISDARNFNTGELVGEEGQANLTADWCSSPPRFVGNNQLWATSQDNGFMALRFTNGVYPLDRGRGRGRGR